MPDRHFPSGIPSCAVVDLTLIAGIPRFEQALDATLDAIVVDRTEATLESQSHPAHEWITARLDSLSLNSHGELKAQLPETQLVVSPGESTPYANVILHCGVPF
jgi:D-ribose pyranase